MMLVKNIFKKPKLQWSNQRSMFTSVSKNSKTLVREVYGNDLIHFLYNRQVLVNMPFVSNKNNIVKAISQFPPEREISIGRAVVPYMQDYRQDFVL
ncbi:hypothetical protein EON73_00840 [bacterium]|nr:MAG: hypothetical protein EON73_00840 [bacterium]